MSKTEQKLTMREVQLLGYHAARCPYCNRTIFIPEYRLQPGTDEDPKKFGKEVMKRIKLEAET